MSTTTSNLDASTGAVQPQPRASKILAWLTTGAFAAMMTFSGTMFLVAPARLTEAMSTLGYPPYFYTLLGVAKLLGVVGILNPRSQTIREWAYAGFAFDLIAAIVSHAATGGASHISQAFFMLALLGASYALRRRISTPSASLASERIVMTPWTRRSIWFGRIVLGGAVLLLTRLGLGYVLDPVGATAPHQMTLGSPEAITIMRVVGGIFVGIAISLAACVISERRVLVGLGVLATIATMLTAVRFLGLALDGPAPFTLRVLKPEVLLVLLSTAAFFVERRRVAALRGARDGHRRWGGAHGG